MAESLGKLQACHTGTCVAGLKAPTASEIAVDRDVEKSTVLKTWLEIGQLGLYVC